ncbi:MAG: DUF2828 family protein [Ruminococcus sp.]|nr:DUF2828 family protein [Ruminococcus sp.]
MLQYLKEEANYGLTENGAVTLRSSGTHCLDLFFRAGAMRNVDEQEIREAVTQAYIESPLTALKLIFFARDVRGGLGERRFFRIALDCVNELDSDAVKRNMSLIPEYGRWDDLLVLLDSPLQNETAELIRGQLAADNAAMAAGETVSLLAKWLPSINASSKETKAYAVKLAGKLGMTNAEYRKTLSALRAYIDIIENHLRESDYSFEYSKQPSRAMMKYRKAFIEHDNSRYMKFIGAVNSGEAKLHAGTLYPYDIVRSCLGMIGEEEKAVLDATWRSLPSFGNGDENALAVVDGSGSMTWAANGNIRPLDVAISLGIYFAEHNKGGFANHFITFSQRPQLVEIKGDDIFEKVRYCSSYNECANTDLEAVFLLLLNTARKNHLPQKDMPSKLFIISDMEFDYCVIGGNSDTLYHEMKKLFRDNGYALPQVVFWNVNSRSKNIPVSMKESGTALVSGASPAIFDMVAGGDISPEKIMEKVLNSERYAAVV